MKHTFMIDQKGVEPFFYLIVNDDKNSNAAGNWTVTDEKGEKLAHWIMSSDGKMERFVWTDKAYAGQLIAGKRNSSSGSHKAGDDEHLEPSIELRGLKRAVSKEFLPGSKDPDERKGFLRHGVSFPGNVRMERGDINWTLKPYK